MSWRVIEGDCVEQMYAMGDESVDAVLTDPPYNVGKDYGEGHDDEREDFLDWWGEWLGEAARVSRDGVVFFPGRVNMNDAPALCAQAKLRVIRWLGWHRREFAGDKWTGGPAMCWEPVVWASKLWPEEGNKPFYNRIFGHMGRDFLIVNSTHGDPFARRHPCPKPLPVMKWLVGLFVPEGGSVLDPFAGTGTTLRAAEDLGRDSIGIEANPAYCALTRERMAQTRLGGRMTNTGREGHGMNPTEEES